MLRYYYVSAIYCLLVVFSFLFANTSSLLVILLAVSTIIYAVVIFWGVSNIRSQMFVKSFNFNPEIKNKVAITFDDGPHEINTPKLLDILKKHNGKASFFLIGKNIVKYTEITKRINKEGHLIGNHSFNHGNTFSVQLPEKTRTELIKTQAEINKISVEEKFYFRPPYGVTNPLIARAISKLDLMVIGWNIRSFDTTNRDKKRILNRITGKLKSGDIILLHDKTKDICWLTDEVLKYLKNNNLEAVTIEELLK